MSEKGYITIQRKITEWRWWGNPNAMSLWLYILVKANWQDRWWDRGQEVVKRGEFITSQLKIADELHLNRRTVTKYLKLFAEEGQIELKVDNRKTLIKVINYAKYQDVPDDDAQLDAQLTAQVNAQQSTQQTAQLDAHNRTNITIKPLNNKESIYSNTTYSHKYQRKNSPLLNMIQEYSDNEEVISALIDFAKMRKVMKKPLTERALKILLNKLDKLADSDAEKIKVIEQSIQYNWQGFFELKPQENNYGLGTSKPNTSKPASWQDEPPTKPEDYGEFQNW